MVYLSEQEGTDCCNLFTDLLGDWLKTKMVREATIDFENGYVGILFLWLPFLQLALRKLVSPFSSWACLRSWAEILAKTGILFPPLCAETHFCCFPSASTQMRGTRYSSTGKMSGMQGKTALGLGNKAQWDPAGSHWPWAETATLQESACAKKGVGCQGGRPGGCREDEPGRAPGAVGTYTPSDPHLVHLGSGRKSWECENEHTLQI